MTIETTDWHERFAREREWLSTPEGQAFNKYEGALIAYWQADGNEGVGDRRLKALDEACKTARVEFLKLFRGW
jgi:hypothetical protein